VLQLRCVKAGTTTLFVLSAITSLELDKTRWAREGSTAGEMCGPSAVPYSIPDVRDVTRSRRFQVHIALDISAGEIPPVPEMCSERRLMSYDQCRGTHTDDTKVSCSSREAIP
jgi:hypothetical protein